MVESNFTSEFLSLFGGLKYEVTSAVGLRREKLKYYEEKAPENFRASWVVGVRKRGKKKRNNCPLSDRMEAPL